MKKLFFTLLIVFFSFSIFSQSFNGGAMFGIVGSEVDGDSLGGLKKVGLAASFFTSLRFSKTFSLQFEILYIQKGSQKNADFDAGDFKSYKLKTDYFELPVLFQIQVVNWFQLEAGPSIAFLVNGKEFIDGTEITPCADFKPVTFNFIVGGNIEFLQNFIFNIRFDTSLDPIRKANFTGNVKRFPTFQYGQYHNCLVLSLKYRFLNSKKK